ncbi:MULTISPECIES: aspartyl protease family protein [Yersinia]|uniref:aspartyl protease family protein n=1 Tax=Yersinia TaxID=629 RepID=UPI0011A4D86A|nr:MULTISPECIES: aspartyl protease family protein [Yersinia]MDA5543485.1 aspartyl protease family protein [Yersinia rochesterensis]UZM73712.1 aspartyl protease family protein [Yersinia sp. SCPM-O-B-9106 (C-191)]
MHFLPNKNITAMTFVLFSALATPTALHAITSEKVMHMPFKWDDTATPIVNIEINGMRQNFMIDTGALIALHLFKDVIAQLPGLIPEPGKHRTTDLTGKVFLNDKFYIPKLSINGMEFKNVKGISVNTPQGMVLNSDSTPPHSMMIGLDLFKGKAVLIDYQKQRLSVADNTQALGINMADGWTSLPLRLTPEGLEIKVVKNAKEYNMLLDTGATVSVFFKERLKSPAVSLSCQTVMKEMDHKGCVASDFQLNEIGATEIGFNAVLLDGQFNQMDTDGLIGNNFLNEFALAIDFPKQRLLIKKFKNE